MSIPEILELLTTAARDPGAAPDEAFESGTDPVSQPLSAVDRETLASELRAAGLAEPQLDEPRLLAARQLRSDGVPLHEIVQTLRATSPEPSAFVAGTPDAPPTAEIAPLLSGEAGQSLSRELRQAAGPESLLDDSGLMAAQQLRAAGVPVHEIRDNVDAVASGAGRD